MTKFISAIVDILFYKNGATTPASSQSEPSGYTILFSLCLLVFLCLSSSPSCLAQRYQNPTFEQNHPRRTEVLRSDAALKNQLNSDYGPLGGNYPQLMSEDQQIHAQEELYARQNGGFITLGQWQQLDANEASLQNQINQDNNQAQVQSNPWQDSAPLQSSSGVSTQSSGLMSVLGAYNGQACGWAGSGGFGAGGTSRILPELPPTSTSTVDLNVAF